MVALSWKWLVESDRCHRMSELLPNICFYFYIAFHVAQTKFLLLLSINCKLFILDNCKMFLEESGTGTERFLDPQ